MASGWNWIADFDGLTPGPFSSQGSWLTAEGSWEIAKIGGTQTIISTIGTDLSTDSWSKIQDNLASQGVFNTESLTLALGQTFEKLSFRIKVQ